MKSLRKIIGMSKGYQKEVMTRLTSLTSKVQCVIYSYVISVRQTVATPIQEQTRGTHTKLCWSVIFRQSVIVSKPSFLP